jgi:endonuclease/exonuclease/phosphatase family metal-dependent hydrolase
MSTELCDEKNISRETYDNTFRVATLNVHQWRNDNDGDNTTEIAKLLAPYKLDIIGLQEARHNTENTNDKLVQLSTILDIMPKQDGKALETLFYHDTLFQIRKRYKQSYVGKEGL